MATRSSSPGRPQHIVGPALGLGDADPIARTRWEPVEVLVCAVCLVEEMARAAVIILCVDDCYAWWVGRPSNMFGGTLISSLSGD